MQGIQILLMRNYIHQGFIITFKKMLHETQYMCVLQLVPPHLTDGI